MRAAAALLLLASGCLSIKADIEESCITRQDVQIEGAATGTFAQTFVIDDLSDVHRLMEHGTTTLEFVRADIVPKSGVTSLGFVDRANVMLESMPIFACDGDCPDETGALALLSATGADATQYLAADQVNVGLEVTGALPATAWTVDVDVCVRGTVEYSATP
jgi:hypothetical protein